jgi:hypothetical protein
MGQVAPITDGKRKGGWDNRCSTETNPGAKSDAAL